jgi:hypothetical protein
MAARRRSRRGAGEHGGQGAHEHQGSAGMLSPNLIWSETGQRVVIDGGVNLGLLTAAMAAGVPRARAMEGGKGGEESLQEDDVMLMMALVGVEGFCTGWSAEDRAAAEERDSPALWSGSSGAGN